MTNDLSHLPKLSQPEIEAIRQRLDEPDSVPQAGREAPYASKRELVRDLENTRSHSLVAKRLSATVTSTWPDPLATRQ